MARQLNPGTREHHGSSLVEQHHCQLEHYYRGRQNYHRGKLVRSPAERDWKPLLDLKCREMQTSNIRGYGQWTKL